VCDFPRLKHPIKWRLFIGIVACVLLDKTTIQGDERNEKKKENNDMMA
jgi:hypothetical protein